MIIIYLLIFIFGLFIGSFLNCVIYRLEKGESFLKGRSYCPNCNHQLAWYDLIPLFSFVFLRGRCRYCKKRISWQYPLVELSTAILFILPAFSSSFSFIHSDFLFSLTKEIEIGQIWPIIFAYVFYLFMVSFLIIIFIFDLKNFIILDKVLYSALAFSLIYRLAIPMINNQLSTTNYQLSAVNYLLSALGASAFFFLIYFISKGKWLGFGDVKLAILLGLLLGWPKILLGIFLSFIIGGIIGTGLILFSKKTLKSEVPFAPFLIIGTLIAFLWGGPIISWYSNLVF